MPEDREPPKAPENQAAAMADRLTASAKRLSDLSAQLRGYVEEGERGTRPTNG